MADTSTPITSPRNIRGLECKPDMDMCMRRIEAWYHREVLDRPPVRFVKHNAQHETGAPLDTSRWPTLHDRWHDTGHQLDSFEQSIKNKIFRAETFPVFMPNLGPSVYSAFYGGSLGYGEITTWYDPIINNLDDLSPLAADPFQNAYFKKIEGMTRAALARCGHKYWVGYTDLHPSLDCAAAWCGPETLFFGMADEPEKVAPLLELSVRDFHAIFGHFDSILKAAGQPSVTWMSIPCFHGKFHIPSSDAASMISNDYYRRFTQPLMRRELEGMARNIYHVDGKGVAQHLDMILSEPDVHAIQWVQGVGTDWPILQWVPLIKRVLAAGKAVLVDVPLGELTQFMAKVPREGVFLCLDAGEDNEEDVLRRVQKWR
jgi:hypothetical protein